MIVAMTGRRLNLITFTSVILFIIVAGMCILSFVARAALPGTLSIPGWQLQSCDGRIFLVEAHPLAGRIWASASVVNPMTLLLNCSVEDSNVPAFAGTGSTPSGFLHLPRASLHNGGGFDHMSLRMGSSNGAKVTATDVIQVYAMPYWPMLAVTAALCWPLVLFWARSRARLRAGLCLNCGYDLRATPERCPECGTLVDAGSKRNSEQHSPRPTQAQEHS